MDIRSLGLHPFCLDASCGWTVYSLNDSIMARPYQCSILHGDITTLSLPSKSTMLCLSTLASPQLLTGMGLTVIRVFLFQNSILVESHSV